MYVFFNGCFLLESKSEGRQNFIKNFEQFRIKKIMIYLKKSNPERKISPSIPKTIQWWWHFICQFLFSLIKNEAFMKRIIRPFQANVQLRYTETEQWPEMG